MTEHPIDHLLVQRASLERVRKGCSAAHNDASDALHLAANLHHHAKKALEAFDKDHPAVAAKARRLALEQN